MKTRVTALVALLAVVLSCARGVVAPRTTIEPAELAARISKAGAPVVLDVRTPEEFASGHIPGAVNVPLSDLKKRLGELGLSPTAEVVVHCEGGGRAETAEEILREAGYKDVRDLTGHMRAWRDAGYPVE